MHETRITWGYVYTMNLGNFESLKIDHLIDDYVREGETYDQATKRIKAMAKKELQEEVNVLKKELKENG